MPYDRFVDWQLAGDELADDDPLAMAATGFLGAGAFPTQLTEAEFESARYNELDDMVATTGSAFLGLSVGCARCHDHKYDPISSDEYYGLAAVFTKTVRSEVEMDSGIGSDPTKIQVTAEGYPPVKHHADDRGFPHYYPKTYQASARRRRSKAGRGPARCARRPGQGRSEYRTLAGRARRESSRPRACNGRPSPLADRPDSGAGRWLRASRWSTGSGSTTWAGAWSPRPMTSAPRGAGRLTPSCSTGSPMRSSRTVGG